ncbi:MAG: superinfection exclusion B family protein [Alphaproteobacteria bacterium]|nr:superinfection exclusion B family protein [Alphaproteobacteria bacterium]
MELITAVWRKISKPLHFLLVGITLIHFAPQNLSWTGYIFIAVGTAGSIEWGVKRFKELWQTHRLLKSAFNTLNEDEKSILLQQLERGERTFYLNVLALGNSIPQHMHLANVYKGLQDKRILTINSTDSKNATLHITKSAWNLLNKGILE